MFDLGWSKLIIIAIVAIIVVGPKDLPPLLRAIGKFLGQMRQQADEFRAHFNEAMRDTGLDDVRRDIEGIKSTATATVTDITRSVEESTRPLQDAATDFERAARLEPQAESAAANGTVDGLANGHADADLIAAEPAPRPLSPAAVAAAAAAGKV